jgi:hypothetical protein
MRLHLRLADVKASADAASTNDRDKKSAAGAALSCRRSRSDWNRGNY